MLLFFGIVTLTLQQQGKQEQVLFLNVDSMVSILSLRDQHCVLFFANVKYFHVDMFGPYFTGSFCPENVYVYYVSCIHLGDRPNCIYSDA